MTLSRSEQRRLDQIEADLVREDARLAEVLSPMPVGQRLSRRRAVLAAGLSIVTGIALLFVGVTLHGSGGAVVLVLGSECGLLGLVGIVIALRTKHLSMNPLGGEERRRLGC